MVKRGSRTKWNRCTVLSYMAAPIWHFLGEFKGLDISVVRLAFQLVRTLGGLLRHYGSAAGFPVKSQG